MTPYPYLPLICVAIGFSWKGFASLFAAGLDLSQRHVALLTVATAVFISAVACVFVRHDLMAGMIVLAGGIVVASVIARRLPLSWSCVVAVCSFAAYLHGVDA